jgi:hypothetical protein
MPVKGLSDRLRLPRLGKIRLGEKRVHEKTGKEYPASLDYFVVPDEVKTIYGDQPRKLDVMLPMEKKEIFFPVWFKRYGSSKGLICKGDGEAAVRIDEASGEMTEIECLGKACPYFEDDSCKTVGNLQVVLHKIPGLGVYQIDTSSYNSIVNLNSSIEMIRGMLGRVSWVPLILKVEMQEAHPRVNGNRIKTIIPVMNLTADISVETLLNDVEGKKVARELPEPQVQIDNPKVDEKEDLLYPEKESEKDLGWSGEPIKPEKPKPTKTAKEIPKDKIDKEEGTRLPLKKGSEFQPSSRNRLNIAFHSLKRNLIKVGIWTDEKYRSWLDKEFKTNSSKDLSDDQLKEGTELMSKLWNEREKGGKK